MISNSGRYWATGITVQWHAHSGSRQVDGQRVPHSGWSATVEYFDDGFVSDNTDAGSISTQGKIATRYAVRDGEHTSGLTAAIDTVLADAERLGIEFRDEADGPYLYMHGDGEWKDVDYPDGWRAVLAAESARLGWNSIYTTEATR